MALKFFKSQRHLSNHAENDCSYIYTILPTTELKINKQGKSIPLNILKFVNFEKQLKIPFCICADFESILKPIPHNLLKSGNSGSSGNRSLDAPEMFIKILEKEVTNI